MSKRQGSRQFGWKMPTGRPRRVPINPEQRAFRTAAIIGGSTLALGLLGLAAERTFSSKEGNCSVQASYVRDGGVQTMYSLNPRFSLDIINPTGEGAVAVASLNGGRDLVDMNNLRVGVPKVFDVPEEGQPFQEKLTATLEENGNVSVRQERCTR